MKSFMLSENIRLYQAHLLGDLSPRDREDLTCQLSEMRRELALYNVGSCGTQSFPTEFGSLAPKQRVQLQVMVEKTDRPTILIDPRAGFHIVDLNHAYETATLIQRDSAAGEGMFTIFPDNPDLEKADGVANLFGSIQQATQTRQTHAMPLQRYDVRDADGHFVTRYWQVENIPILNENGQVTLILHQASDVTERYS
jgi:PAS domain-containing protein